MYRVGGAVTPDQFKVSKPVLVADGRLAINHAYRTGSDLSAMAMNGKRSVKSFPARVISRTPAASLRARMRKPSCLISCSQPGPEALAGEGKHGSMMPSPGRVRSRNDMRVY